MSTSFGKFVRHGCYYLAAGAVLGLFTLTTPSVWAQSSSDDDDQQSSADGNNQQQNKSSRSRDRDVSGSNASQNQDSNQQGQQGYQQGFQKGYQQGYRQAQQEYRQGQQGQSGNQQVPQWQTGQSSSNPNWQYNQPQRQYSQNQDNQGYNKSMQQDPNGQNQQGQTAQQGRAAQQGWTNQPNNGWQQQGFNNQSNSQQGRGYAANSRQGNQSGDQNDVVHYQGHERAALGVTLAEHHSGAVLVSNVFPGSPAARAGLQQGDRITGVNQQPIRSYRDLIQVIGNSSPNSQVQLHLDRNGQPMTVAATLASPQSFEHASAQQGSSNPSSDEQSQSYRGNGSDQNNGR
ncbi:MAG TPA: PDZ domain-containing protein [Pirellulales bacterium]